MQGKNVEFLWWLNMQILECFCVIFRICFFVFVITKRINYVKVQYFLLFACVFLDAWLIVLMMISFRGKKLVSSNIIVLRKTFEEVWCLFWIININWFFLSLSSFICCYWFLNKKLQLQMKIFCTKLHNLLCFLF